MNETSLLSPLPAAASRRPRAGTMPSILTVTAPRADDLRRQLSGLSLESMPRLAGEHAAPSRSNKDGGVSPSSLKAPASTAARLRSGSLTLPTNGIANAFGTSVFSPSWTPTERSGQPSPAIPEEIRSANSEEDQADAAGTLDYLGLYGSPLPSPTPGSVPSVSLDAQVHKFGDTGHTESINRLRANTVAVFPRQDQGEIPSSLNAVQATDAYDVSGSTVSDKLHSSTSNGILRPRAATIGLSYRNGNRILRSNVYDHYDNTGVTALHLSDDTQSMLMKRQSSQPTDHETTRSAIETPPSLPPSRTLWIGNLDPSVTVAELVNVFAPYGAIETIRVLAEKCIAFVNFYQIQSAVQARADLTSRLSGHGLQKQGSTTMGIRIGYGRPEGAAPAVMGSSALAIPSSGSESQMVPTRALWVGAIPALATNDDLLRIFSPWGPIESTRILAQKACAFINYERLEDAVRARKALNGREIFGDQMGQIKVGFARVPSKQAGLIDAYQASASQTPSGPLAGEKGEQDVISHQSLGLPGAESDHWPSPQPSDTGSATADKNVNVADLQMLLSELAPDDAHVVEDLASMAQIPPAASYYTHVPPPLGVVAGSPEDIALARGQTRFSTEGHRLRDLRKRIESGVASQSEIDAHVLQILDDAPVLASDYIGNTLIQRLYERSGLMPRIALLERIGPQMASLGCHRNGTWAAQKIIEMASTAEEVNIICRHLRPYIPPLMLDQFGNYVVSCTLRFGPPASDMIFDAMVNRCWDIAQGRFGARSMRTCLESSHTTAMQQRRVAAAIILNSVPLATNPNGVLLLTWLLEHSGLAGRYGLLAPRLCPHLMHLCINRNAASIILRLVNQQVDAKASHMIVEHFFSRSLQTLDDVLVDQLHGVNFVQRLMACSGIDADQRALCLERIYEVVHALQLAAVPAYSQLLQNLATGAQPSLADVGPHRGPRKSSPHARTVHPTGGLFPNDPVHPQWTGQVRSAYPDQALSSSFTSWHAPVAAVRYTDPGAIWNAPYVATPIDALAGPSHDP